MNTCKRMSHDQGAERQSLCTRNKTPALRCEGWIGRWVGYTVNRLSGQRSGVRAAPSAVIFPIQLKPEGVDTSVLFVANRSRWYPNLKSLVNFWHLGIGGGTGGGRHRVTGSPWMRYFNINPGRCMERMVSKVSGAPFGRSRSAAIASGLNKRPENGQRPETFFSTRLSTVRWHFL